MMYDDDACYRAVLGRDARFDGKFFTGVTSTGIYCRPICPAKAPKREHVRFFACAAAAEAAGFRPCKRCRPETAPAAPVWQGTGATVSRGMRLIADGFLDEHSMETLAERLGIGARHLRRLFVRHLGAPPRTFDVVRRTHLAALLLSGSDLPITAAAFDSGFGSVRQFNDAFRKSFGIAPSEVRRRGVSGGAADGPELRLRLSYRPPFDWPGTLRFLARRAVMGVETVTETAYRRSFSLASKGAAVAGSVEIEDCGDADELVVSVNAPPTRLSGIVGRIRAMFDLHGDPTAIGRVLGSEPLLGELAHRFPGIRIPSCWDPFEAAVRAVVGQQISVKAAVALLGRAARLCARSSGDRPGESDELAFPSPESLLACDLDELGMPQARRETLRALARAWLDGTVPAGGFASVDELVAALCSVSGVGPWTAHYIALRGYGEPDAFPASDLGLRAAAGALLGREGPLSARELERRAEAWRPWRGYAAMLLWRSHVEGEERRKDVR